MNDNRRRVILVVEDEPFIQMLIADFLEELGYATLVASDAKSALISLEADGELDLLLTDIGLPDMNGWALAEIARNLRPSLPILFATGYGEHVATEMAAALAERGWTVISGGAYGIDSAAHCGALGAEGITVAVLASGLGYGYPKGHLELFSAIAGQGILVSEWPPDRAPTRAGFLVRNRVIAALSCGTVVVEAALRSGALSTARHARDLCRPLMAVPGPVTSGQSEGCHEIIREWGAVLVTGARDVIENVSPAGDALGAAFAWSMEKRKSFSEALRWGVATGTAAAKLPGLSFPTFNDARAIYKQVELRQAR